MPDWNWWTGHLLVLKDNLDRLPADANPYYAMQDLVLKQHSDTEIFLMDYWPIHEPILMISSPEIATQVSNKYTLQKPHNAIKSFAPIVGGDSLITMNGDDWKTWRALFNPGFSASHMLDLVPTIVDSVDVFCQLLRERADGGVFSLSVLTMRLTMEIITKVTLDSDLDNQRSEHSYARALGTVVNWHSFWDPRVLLNPARPFVQWYYGSIVYSFIRGELGKRFEEMKRERLASPNPSKRAKSVMALALDAYITQKKQTEGLEELCLEEEFAHLAVNQIRLFVFAGNDSTSSTIDYTYHLLSKNPDAMTRVREEHDQIFGPIANTASLLKDQPALLNQCTYTLAVIKEVMRLYPPSSSLREGRPGVSITDNKGNMYPTEGLGVTLMHYYIHRNTRFWPRASEFLPERWLAGPDHELYVSQTNGAYRPFETGSRNCIAHTLVYNELRIILILTARTFDLSPAYEEWDMMQRQNEGLLKRVARGLGLVKEKCKTVMGERAYQTTLAGAHPADGYPCRVSLATAKKE
jgi:cytochrome P450